MDKKLKNALEIESGPWPRAGIGFAEAIGLGDIRNANRITDVGMNNALLVKKVGWAFSNLGTRRRHGQIWPRPCHFQHRHGQPRTHNSVSAYIKCSSQLSPDEIRKQMLIV
jgi:hypothetical protein